jgi:transposase
MDNMATFELYTRCLAQAGSVAYRTKVVFVHVQSILRIRFGYTLRLKARQALLLIFDSTARMAAWQDFITAFLY